MMARCNICSPGHDPRFRNTCVKCGRPLLTLLPQPEPETGPELAGPPSRRRDLQGEREMIAQAALTRMDPERLTERCLARASGELAGAYVPDPMLVRLDVDQLREVREEIEDAVIRLVWWVQDNIGQPGAVEAFDALSALTRAYALVD